MHIHNKISEDFTFVHHVLHCIRFFFSKLNLVILSLTTLILLIFAEQCE
jgi:hypothetical protein